MMNPELHRALKQNEYLRLDNVLLARRAAQMERQLEMATRATNVSLIGSLLGWSAPEKDDLGDALAEVDARLEENAKLQHAFLEQQRDHQLSIDELKATQAASTIRPSSSSANLA